MWTSKYQNQVQVPHYIQYYYSIVHKRQDVEIQVHLLFFPSLHPSSRSPVLQVGHFSPLFTFSTIFINMLSSTILALLSASLAIAAPIYPRYVTLDPTAVAQAQQRDDTATRAFLAAQIQARLFLY